MIEQKLGAGDTAALHGEALSIRPPCWRDWPQLAELYRRLFPELSERQIAAFIVKDRAEIIVAAQGQRIVGMYHWFPRHDIAWLNYFGVMPHCHRLGIGTRLLQDWERRAAAMGFHRSELDVLPQNQRAIAFYERHGFARLHGRVEKVRYGKALAGAPASGDPQRATFAAPHRATLAHFARRIAYHALVGLARI